MTPTNPCPKRLSNVLLLAAAAAVTLSGCGTSPVSGPAYPAGSTGAETTAARQEVVQTAGQLIGTPYRYGGSDPNGFDCSGLVQYTHRRAGIAVPRTTGQQIMAARVTSRGDLIPGDLLFFHIDAQKARHVGIYEGGGVFIHAPSSGKQVSRASLDNPYWNSRLIATRTFF